MDNDRTLMCKPYAWKVLGILPVLKASAVTNQDEEWQKQRRLRLYHRCMDYVVADENELCKEGRYLRFADKRFDLYSSSTISPAWTDGDCCHSTHLHQGLPHL